MSYTTLWSRPKTRLATRLLSVNSVMLFRRGTRKIRTKKGALTASLALSCVSSEPLSSLSFRCVRVRVPTRWWSCTRRCRTVLRVSCISRLWIPGSCVFRRSRTTTNTGQTRAGNFLEADLVSFFKTTLCLVFGSDFLGSEKLIFFGSEQLNNFGGGGGKERVAGRSSFAF